MKLQKRIQIIIEPSGAGSYLARVNGEEIGEQITAGDSIAEAVGSVADLLRLIANECKNAHVAHCFCCDELLHDVDGKRCCICNTWVSNEH